MKTYRVAFFFLIMLITTLACALVDDVLEPEPTLAPPPTTSGLQSTATTTAADEPTPAAAATATLAVTPSLVAPSLDELGSPPDSLPALQGWLGRARMADLPLAEVCNLLQQAQWQRAEDSCESHDLNADEEAEWLVTLDITRLQEDQSALPLEGHPGDFWIVNPEGVIYQERGSDDLDFFGSAPLLLDVVDMTGDDRPEAVTVFTTCGAHTCFNNYQIIGAPQEEIENLIQLPEGDEVALESLPETISLSSVDLEEIRDETGDDVPDLVIRGGIVGSAGAGIQRARTEIWSWSTDESAVVLAEQQWQETGYRFHELYNANYAFEEEQVDIARTRYEAVITDPALEDIEWATGTPEEVRAHTRQFAGFRLALLPLLRGDITEATRWRNWLQSEYPGAPITEAAAVLIPEWQANGNDLAAACQVVTDLLQARDNPTGPLRDMGYNNPSLNAEDVCPIR